MRGDEGSHEFEMGGEGTALTDGSGLILTRVALHTYVPTTLGPVRE